LLPRADVRDVLIGAASITALPEGATVGTSAPRRAAQLLHARPDCRVITFRGNVDTRLARLAAGEADATFLAAAGLERLGKHGIGTPLGLDEWLSAPSQGAIGIECRADDAQAREWLAAIGHEPSRAQVEGERALLAALGGSCHSPIAVVSEGGEGEIALRAALFSPDGAERVEGTATFTAGDNEGPKRLAHDLLARAAPAIAAHFTGAR
jgi:hydroxymethylbilane synthase